MSAIRRARPSVSHNAISRHKIKWNMDSWKGNDDLKTDLCDFTRRNFKRLEMLDFLKKKYPTFSWSLRTLARRLKYFDSKYVRHDVDLGHVEEAIQKEMNGPGRLLGYRSLHKKLRELYCHNIPRDLVYKMMQQINPEGLKERGQVGLPRRRPRNRAFSSKVLCIHIIICPK